MNHYVNPAEKFIPPDWFTSEFLDDTPDHGNMICMYNGSRVLFVIVDRELTLQIDQPTGERFFIKNIIAKSKKKITWKTILQESLACVACQLITMATSEYVYFTDVEKRHAN